MYYHIFIFNALLFFILVPNIIVSFSSNTSKYIVAFIHALIFGVVFTNAFKYYKEYVNGEIKSTEGIKGGLKSSKGKRFCYSKAKEGKNKCLKEAKNKDTEITCRETYRTARIACRQMI